MTYPAATSARPVNHAHFLERRLVLYWRWLAVVSYTIHASTCQPTVRVMVGSPSTHLCCKHDGDLQYVHMCSTVGLYSYVKCVVLYTHVQYSIHIYTYMSLHILFMRIHI
jgi:hypothetical protein